MPVVALAAVQQVIIEAETAAHSLHLSTNEALRTMAEAEAAIKAITASAEVTQVLFHTMSTQLAVDAELISQLYRQLAQATEEATETDD